MATNVKIPSINLQTEIAADKARIASININVEIDPDIIVLYAPTVTTTSPATNITQTSADVAGNVSSDGGATITERGFVYGTSANPTTANSKATVAGTTGSMTASITGLTASTTYHVRGYATNSVGTSYGADVEFTTLTPVTTGSRLKCYNTSSWVDDPLKTNEVEKPLKFYAGGSWQE